MLKTYRIIPLVFILFLFGFTLITVAPVFAQGQWDKSMGMRHPDRPCMIVNSCGVDGRSPAQIASDPFDTGVHSPMPTSTSPSGGEVAQLNARIAELEAENARLIVQQGEIARTSGIAASNSLQKYMKLQSEHMIKSLEVGRLQNVQSEVQYLCKLSGGGTIDSNRWVSPLTRNLKRMCIPSTANKYGYEVK